MLKIATGFSLHYGLNLGWLASMRDAEQFSPMEVDLDEYLAGGCQMIEETAREAREFSLIRPWLEFLIAASERDLTMLGLADVRRYSDITLQHPGIGAMFDEEWHHVFEYMRQKLFHLDKPMTDEEKQRVRREVTIVEESLEDFRTRMRAEGRLPDPE